MTFQAGAESTRGPGRPAGSRNRRTQDVLDLIKDKKDPLVALAEIIDTSTVPEHRMTASNILAPYLHSKRGMTQAPRFVDDPIQVPEFTSIEAAQNFLAEIAAGELELQVAQDISNLVKNWVLSITAQDEFQLKLSAANGSGDQTITIQGGMPPLPGTNINMAQEPSLNGQTNGHIIEHEQPAALTDSAQPTSEAQEP